jgi:hypothetical protein
MNIAKGSNRILKFERDGNIQPDVFHKLAAALEISADDIRRCVEADKAEWEAWASEPIEPHLVARIMPAVYSTKRIPAELQASCAIEEFASAFAKERRWRVWLGRSNWGFTPTPESFPGGRNCQADLLDNESPP